MRQRKIQDVEKKIAQHEHLLVRNPDALAGQWYNLLSSECIDSESGENISHNESQLFIEIGSGKGRFLIAKSALNLYARYVGFEGQLSVLYRALIKASTLAAPNFKFCPEYIYDIREFFAADEIDGIYLNFSDPWPKARQEKRRLTSPVYLNGYLTVLKPGGFIEFKTDNAALFSYSAERIKECQGFILTDLTDDLHRSQYADENVETEYEHKFRNLNRAIHFLRAIKKEDER